MIQRFRGKYSFLSNFAACPMIYEGINYPTAEHAFQAAKFEDEKTKRHIADLNTPVEAKRYGRIAGPPRKGWGTLRLQVMEEILRIKFSKEAFKDSLLRTGDEELIEGNDWGDKFWGVSDGEGSNYLGKLLMKIRDEMKVSPP